MKRRLLLATALLGFYFLTSGQNVFNPNDAATRYNSTQPLGSAQNPDPNIVGLQKWVSVPTIGISLGGSAYDASSYKPYFINVGGVKLPFRVKFPRSYTNADSASKKYPAMLFLHGAAESGCPENGGIYNNEKQLLVGGKEFMERANANQFDGFLIYPQLWVSQGGCWSAWGTAAYGNYDAVISFIDSLIKYARMDIDRLFVDGLSAGGYGAWRIAEAYPTRVAKIAPSAAAGFPNNRGLFVHIPIWFATGGLDPDPSPAQAQSALNAMKQLGADIRYTMYPDRGHSVWLQHWAEPDFMPYMNDVHKANPLVFFQRYDVCPDSVIEVKLGITQGFFAYEWQKDGVLIASRTNGVNTIHSPSSVVSYTGNDVVVKSYGSYRVRFKRSSTSNWSDWSPKPAVIKVKQVTKTAPIVMSTQQSKVLPSLDGKTSVPLELTAGFINYQWYRVSDNALVASQRTYNAPAGQYRAKYHEPYGCGSEFSPVFTVVNANGTPKPDVASNLNASLLTRSSIQLSWDQNATPAVNETGFEVYRRTSPTASYQFVTLTPANATGYTDTGLSLNTLYYYTVRPVGDNGAAAVTNEATAKTPNDNLAPSAPVNLQYRGSTANSVSLRWGAASDNSSIRRYDVYVNGTKFYSTTNTFANVLGLTAETSYTFTVKAVDPAGNSSPASNQVVGFTHRQGLNYKYYNGMYTVLPEFNALTPAKTGIVDSIDIGSTAIKTQLEGYAFLWEGFIYIPENGTYTFETNSDDGTKLYLDQPYAGQSTPAFISNDSVHGTRRVTGTRYLTKGYHQIALSYFQGRYGFALEVFWSNTSGLARERIPKNYFAVSAPTTPAGPPTPAQGMNYKYYHGTWTSLPNFNTIAPLKSGQIDTISLNAGIKTRNDNYALLWEGFIYIPVSATYTFETYSDDGTRLYVDVPYSASATPVVTNDGVHGARSVTGNIYLSQGYHQFAVSYFQGLYGFDLQLFWSNNAGMARQRIPKHVLYYSIANPPQSPPSSLSGSALTYNMIRLNWSDNSSTETGFEIVRGTGTSGNYIPVATLPANTVSFTDSGLNGSTAYLYKVRAIAGTGESPYSAEVSVTTPAVPATPIPPSGFVAWFTSGTQVSFTWNDNANNETGFQIWRSSDNTNFQLIATTAANANAYSDATVSPFNTYYYYVSAINAAGSSTPSSTVKAVTGTNAPVLSALNNLFVKTGGTAQADFTVNDDAGDLITVTIPNQPSFITLSHLGGSNYRITATPTIDNLGWYTLNVTAKDDKGGTTISTMTVSVSDINTRSVFVNLGTTSRSAPLPWNNWLGTRTAGSVINNLKDENNATTTFGITAVNAWSTTTDMGHITGNNSGAVPDKVLVSGIADNGVAKELRFTGLSPAMKYNLVFVGSQNEGMNASTEYAAGTQKDTLNARNNTNETANLNGLSPDATGQITVTVSRISSLVTYLNAIIIEEYSPALVVLNPINLYAEATDRNSIFLTWSDRTFAENPADGYQLIRATDSLFNINVVSINLPGNITSYRNTGLTPGTRYWYRVRAKSGGTFSDYSNRSKAVTAASIVYVNFNTAVTNAAFPWNNLAAAPTSVFTVSNLINESGANSGLNLSLEKVFNGEFNAGMNTGNNSGVVPDNVLRANYWLDKTQLSQMRISGLNHTKRYRFGFVGSSSPNGWFKGNYTATYTINGRTVYLNSWQNTTKVVYIDDVVPDEDGNVFLDFSTTDVALYGFNSGVIIHEYSESSSNSVPSRRSVANGNNNLIAATEDENRNGESEVRRIYPNPFTDLLIVDFYNSSSANRVSAELYAPDGRLVMRQQFDNLTIGNNTLRITLNSAVRQRGAYILTFKVNGKLTDSRKLLRSLK
jgi:fibronectin type 3 domain-containing protein/pimeloyl-ACP methyl ester carboxylesterase